MEESLDILDKNKLYVIAVSGGIDSMSLLDLLIKNNYNIVVAYVNHNMRKDTYKDEELVENICRKNNIRLEKIKFNYSKDSNFHDEAHNFRYNFFKKICKKYNTNNIITAHHGDDLIETILIKIFRGSNLYGYSGFEKIETKDNYTYYKPLLEYSKEDIKEYARKNNIEYLEDSTNLEDHYLRNRIRHHILPLIKKETNINKFIEYSNILKESFNYIRNKSKQIVNNLTLDEFLKQDDIIKKDIINYLFEQYNIKSNYISILSCSYMKWELQFIITYFYIIFSIFTRKIKKIVIILILFIFINNYINIIFCFVIIFYDFYIIILFY